MTILRRLGLFAVLAMVASPADRSSAALGSAIIPEPEANRHGLTRPWFTQIQMDRSRARLRHVVLHEGILYAQTDRAMVHALDAETGKTLWARIIGRPDHPSMTPGLGRDLLAVVNGSRLYVVNRYNGDLLYEVQVGGAPGAGAAVSKKRAYVPMVDGMVMAYRLEPLTDPSRELGTAKKVLTEKEKAETEEDRRENLRLSQEYIPPLSCRSFGKALVQPLVTSQAKGEEIVVWPTDRGFLNIAKIDLMREDVFAIKYRLETDAGIAARPTYLPPDPDKEAASGVIFGASRDGFVHAIEERGGQSLWRFSTGEPMVQPAVVVENRVYATTQRGGMFCLDAETGSEIWWAPHLRQFLAASKDRVYAADSLGRILVLRADTGARLDAIEAAASPIKMINSQTDRIYLASETGLVQCLHELELSEPIRHNLDRWMAAAGERLPTKFEDQTPAAGVEPGVGLPPIGGEDPLTPKGGDPLAPPARGPGDPFPPFGGGGANPDPLGGAGGDPLGGGNDPFN
ncbi:MAG TPA: PQQ-binding-like beta-propeller repeat protein [Thermoguttaceae bacterium]|nr:PQQ-binding-like beta-propeller repeat protein [Thermoguttaceae bacterium]